jgi:putative acetyltransferase
VSDSTVALAFRIDDLSGTATQALIERHLRGMYETSPPDSVHAFDLSKLKQPGVTVWSAWAGGEIVGMGALKRLDAQRGEIKSMRVSDAWLGKGVGRAMLDHIVGEARGMGLTSLWLETGSVDAFVPALKLYETAGFSRCGPFGDYKPDPFSIFMMREI